ncbi:sulfotransferase domain-containing protein [Rhodobacteraceae bacterium NNCM2]|nr:sulfotransferase domain-containing protein [Coraliihabitans acroporae]
MTLKNIVWLASYPKSGNTWTRAFLINYLVNSKSPVPINQIHRLGMGDAVTKSYQMVAKGPFDPTNPQDVINLRPAVLRAIASNEADMNFVKSHNANTAAFGQQLVPTPLTRSAVYIMRDPQDMVLSFARHYGHEPGAAIDAIGRDDHAINGDRNSVIQFVGKWSNHVLSWVDCKSFPVHVMRYEDMLENPQQEFSNLLKFLGFPLDEERLDRAVSHASFDELSKQEKKGGFIERSEKSDRFFHSGSSGQWKSALSEEQLAKLRSDQKIVMKRFGYL